MEPEIPAVTNTERYLDLRAVCEITGLSASTLRRLCKAGNGPPVCRISAKLLRWPASSVHTWMQSRAAGSAA